MHEIKQLKVMYQGRNKNGNEMKTNENKNITKCVGYIKSSTKGGSFGN